MNALNTDQYIHQFILQHEDVEFSLIEKIFYWNCKHPLIIKVAEIAGMVFGVGTIILLSFSVQAWGIKAILLAATGGVLALVSFVAYRVLDIFAPRQHSMQHHAFTTATYGVGRIYYQEDVPILELDSDEPYQAGLAYGYLVGEALNRILNQFEWTPLQSKADQVPKTIQALIQKIPAEYMEELEGVVDGYNQWLIENKKGDQTLTVEKLIPFQMLPDSEHFSLERIEKSLEGQTIPEESPFMQKGKLNPAVGCTVVIDEDDKEGIVFGRNMDYPSLGLMGTYSLIINRKYKDQKLSTVEIGIPGFIGTLTGMNKAGVSLAMNICPGTTESVRGIPAAFFNRLCLENCYDLEEVEEMIEIEDPLGSYHLSVADNESAKSFHFYQGSAQSHVTREWQLGAPLITTNYNYPSDQVEKDDIMWGRSEDREQIIKNLFEKATKAVPTEDLEKAKLVQASLGLPFVNNVGTMHKIVMYPQSRKIQVTVDNAYAGEGDLHDLDAGPLLDD